MADNSEKYNFIAILLFEAKNTSADTAPMYQESFVLIQAPTEEEARRLALEHANQSCTSYENAAGETVEWSLKHVIDVNRTLDDELKHGSELYARHFKDYNAYRRFEPFLEGAVD